MTKNFRAYLKLNKKGLENKYVIIVKGKVVEKGAAIEKMLESARKKYPKEIPFVAKVPEESVLIL